MIKKFFCWIGWHSFGYEILGSDGCSLIGKCKWCGGVGLIDSQGNLFSVRHHNKPVELDGAHRGGMAKPLEKPTSADFTVCRNVPRNSL